MFINVSNHSYKAWDEKQLAEARKYGELEEIAFPNIEPTWTGEQVEKLAKEYVEKILAMNPRAVMVQGEFTFTFTLVKLLKAQNVTVLTACTERVAEEKMNADGSTQKVSVFRFVQFREYK